VPRPSTAISGTRITSGSTGGAVGRGWRIPNGPPADGSPARETERLARIGKARESDDRADRAGLFHGQQGADLAADRGIAGDHRRPGADRGELLGEPAFEHRAVGVAERLDERLARIDRGAAQRFLGVSGEGK